MIEEKQDHYQIECDEKLGCGSVIIADTKEEAIEEAESEGWMVEGNLSLKCYCADHRKDFVRD